MDLTFREEVLHFKSYCAMESSWGIDYSYCASLNCFEDAKGAKGPNCDQAFCNIHS